MFLNDQVLKSFSRWIVSKLAKKKTAIEKVSMWEMNHLMNESRKRENFQSPENLIVYAIRAWNSFK